MAAAGISGFITMKYLTKSLFNLSCLLLWMCFAVNIHAQTLDDPLKATWCLGASLISSDAMKFRQKNVDKKAYQQLVVDEVFGKDEKYQTLALEQQQKILEYAHSIIDDAYDFPVVVKEQDKALLTNVFITYTNNKCLNADHYQQFIKK